MPRKLTDIFRLTTWALAWILPACCLSAPGRAAERAAQAASDTPSFLHDVMPVLAKAGCNMGACHGNLNGKGGFQLSLRGQDPWLDHQSLLRQHGGRRVNLLQPDASLLLLKPTLQLAHEGGRRFTRDSLEYDILRSWLAAGAPGPAAEAPQLLRLDVSTTDEVLVEPRRELQLRVMAHFSAGAPRDVTRLAVYESNSLDVTVDAGGLVVSQQPGEATVTVRYLQQQVPVRLAFIAAREDFAWSRPEPRNYVDRLVYERLRTLRINPSPPADDATFVRRVYLDLLGILPTADESREFVAERSADKRQQLVDRLLARPELADRWALIWSDILRNEEKVLDVRGVTVFHDWIRRGMAEGKPLDEFARQLLTASGSTYDHPPANYYRASRDPATRGETTARVFLGIRLQCARCHNHPFDRWTQDDYYSWAALFARVDYEIVKNERADKLDNNEFNGEQIVVVKSEGEVTNPRTAAAALPRVLGEPAGDAPRIAADAERLEPLARWLTARGNRQFARTQANRIWYHLLGRGLVEPIDDFRVTNPAVNEPLLEALAEDLIDSGYDLRHVLRVIVNSNTYQASAEPNATNAADERNFARAVVRRLPAETLLDAQCQVLDVPAEFVGYPRGTRAGQIAGVRRERRRSREPAEGDRFLLTFGKPERLLACDCERSDETTLAQAFVLLGGDGIDQRLAASEGRLRRLADSPAPAADLVDELYWTALGRSPGDAEWQAGIELLDRSATRLEGLQDLAWGLLNSKEFIFRH